VDGVRASAFALETIAKLCATPIRRGPESMKGPGIACFSGFNAVVV
jgi:hypothetical protein